jgi:hypothetical protein
MADDETKAILNGLADLALGGCIAASRHDGVANRAPTRDGPQNCGAPGGSPRFRDDVLASMERIRERIR